MDSLEKRLLSYANAIIENKKICDNQEETLRRIIEYQPELILDAYGIQVEIDADKNHGSKSLERISEYCKC